MIKTLNNNQIALDKSTNLVYNTNMIKKITKNYEQDEEVKMMIGF